MSHTAPTAYPSDHREGQPSVRAHRPRTVAIKVALAWNLLPLTLVLGGAAVALTQQDDSENWALLVAIVLGVFGGGAVLVSAGLAAAIAAMLTRQQTLPDGTEGRSITRASAIRRGGLAALLGWVATIAGVSAYMTVNNLLVAHQVVCC
jgi:hypothetical protein